MTRYVGIDAHKRDLHVTALEEDGDETDHFPVPNTPTGHEDLTDRLEPDTQGVLKPAIWLTRSSNTFSARRSWCRCHPRKLSKLMDPDYKDDDRDSWHLADLLRVGRFPPAYHPDPNAFLARDVLRRREDLGQLIGDVKRRITSLVNRYGLEPPVTDLYTKEGLAWLKAAELGDDRDMMLRHYAEQYDVLEAQKTELENELARRAWEVPEAKLLVTIEGIGTYSALLLVFELGSIERFENLGKFRGYVGSAPRIHQSGDTEIVDGERRSCNRRIKAVLSRATECLIRSRRENPVKTYYHKQRGKGCGTQRAKSRARGKLANCVYAILRKGESCDWADPVFVDRKIVRMERAAKRASA